MGHFSIFQTAKAVLVGLALLVVAGCEPTHVIKVSGPQAHNGSFSSDFRLAVADCMNWVTAKGRNTLQPQWISLENQSQNTPNATRNRFVWSRYSIFMAAKEYSGREAERGGAWRCSLYPVSNFRLKQPRDGVPTYAKSQRADLLLPKSSAFRDTAAWLVASGFTSRPVSREVEIRNGRRVDYRLDGCVGTTRLYLSFVRYTKEHSLGWTWHVGIRPGQDNGQSCGPR